jgi:hypothetical protein
LCNGSGFGDASAAARGASIRSLDQGVWDYKLQKSGLIPHSSWD